MCIYFPHLSTSTTNIKSGSFMFLKKKMLQIFTICGTTFAGLFWTCTQESSVLTITLKVAVDSSKEVEMSYWCLITCDLRYSTARTITILFPMVATHQIRQQATLKVGSQPHDNIWPFNFPRRFRWHNTAVCSEWQLGFLWFIDTVLIKDIRCHVFIASGHLNLPQEFVWVNILTLSPIKYPNTGRTSWRIQLSWSNQCHGESQDQKGSYQLSGSFPHNYSGNAYYQTIYNIP